MLSIQGQEFVEFNSECFLWLVTTQIQNIPSLKTGLSTPVASCENFVPWNKYI